MRLLIQLVLSLAVLLLLVRWLDGPSIRETLSRFTPGALGLMVALYVLNIVLKAFRFQRLIWFLGRRDEVSDSRPRLGFKGGFQVAAVGNFANHVMPARTGEVAFVFFTSGLYGIPLSRSVGVLLVARIYDLCCIVFLLAIGVLLGGLDVPSHVSYILLATSGGLVLALMRLGFVLEMAGRILQWLVGRPLASRVRLLTRLSDEIARVRPKLSAFQEPSFVFEQLGCSLAIWACLNLFFFSTFLAFGEVLSIGRLLVGSTGAFAANLVPVSVVGNIGVLEAGWTAGFALVGVAPEVALPLGVVMHAVAIAVSGASAYLALSWAGSGTWRKFTQWRGARNVSS